MIKIENLSGHRQATWSQPFTLPPSLALTIGEVGQLFHPAAPEHGFVVARLHDNVFSAWITATPHQRSDGWQIRDLPDPQIPFRFHPAIDEIKDLLPINGKVSIAGREYVLDEVSVEHQSAAHIQGVASADKDGMLVRYRVRVMRDSPVVHWYLTVVWTDTTHPGWTLGSKVAWIMGHDVSSEFATVSGGLVSLDVPVKKGLAISARGAVHVLSTGHPWSSALNDDIAAVHIAAHGGPITVTLDASAWLGVYAWDLPPAPVQRFTPDLPIVGSYIDHSSVPAGSHNTGQSEWFGWSLPAQIMPWSESATRDPVAACIWHLLRDHGLRETNYRLSGLGHPGLVTYEGLYGQGGNTEWFGSEPPVAPNPTGRSVMDEEHQQPEIALCWLYALTGDAHVRECLERWFLWTSHDARIQQGSAGMHRAMARRLAPCVLGMSLGIPYAEDCVRGFLIGITAAANQRRLWGFDKDGKSWWMPYMEIMSLGVLIQCGDWLSRQSGWSDVGQLSSRLRDLLTDAVEDGIGEYDGRLEVHWLQTESGEVWRGSSIRQFHDAIGWGMVLAARDGDGKARRWMDQHLTEIRDCEQWSYLCGDPRR